MCTHLLPRCAVTALAALLLASPLRAADSKALGHALRSVVRIQATTMEPDLRAPWNVGRVARGTGSGFVIDGNRIMTNAHVVSNARFLGLQRPDSPRITPATVKYIAHDCDLAVLQVEDKDFFKGLEPLVFGTVPQLHSTVATVGFPVGGQRMSVTRGVVSRIEFRPYTHSVLDAHLTIQTDAAINPGNSGGPVIQNGKVVGVAFQTLRASTAQNAAYMIPTPVIQRFLADIKDGSYDGYPELAIGTFRLTNKPARERLGLPMDNYGMLVTDVFPQGSSDGLLKRDDVLLKIDGHAILSDGQIKLEGEMVQMVEVVERKFVGDTVTFSVRRGDKEVEVKVPLKGAWFYRSRARQYDTLPRYLVYAGLVFQPLTLDFMRAYHPKQPPILDAYEFHTNERSYLERPEIVVLSNRLADPVNTHMDRFKMTIVEQVNGRKVGSLRELDDALSQPAERYVFTLKGEGVPLVLEADKVAAAQARIAKQYGIEKDKNIGTVPNKE
ncbi:MAG: trypsin-like serine protease [Victivallales bacterium]|nr:trypsin-like serine protease [Victivallales bacterium]